MTNKLKKEIELVRKLKNSFPDMLDFNNCLKELRKFWKEQALSTQKQEDDKEQINWLEINRDVINGIDILDVDERLQKLNGENTNERK